MSKKTRHDEPARNYENADEAMMRDVDLIPYPILIPPVSGLYKRSLILNPIPLPQPIPVPIPTHPNPVNFESAIQIDTLGLEQETTELSNAIPILPLIREELRIDVDGRYPQMTISGTIFSGLTERVHWIANVAKIGATWQGGIWYKNGDAATLPYTAISVTVSNSFLPAQRTAKVTFSGGGLAVSTRTYNFSSPYFRDVEFEYDSATGVNAVTQIQTCDHPNRPAGMTCETLSIEKVFQRAGFNTKKSGQDNIVPLAGAGANATWSDSEMHDAMQTYWSKFANKAQWSMWVFFAALHDQGTSLGGIMFDDIGPNHRQGTAMFNNSFIANAPAGDANPAAWVKRMKFWTACHEMGHAFNLAHSWQKSLGAPYGTPWIPLADEPEARSFMNYPYNVSGGQTAFFADFMYRFSNNELKFMRHAPNKFVQQGNADWFDHHAFQQAAVLPEATFKLTVRANRPKPEFEFLEPVVLELKLTNISNEPQIVEKSLLSASDKLTVIIKKRGRRAKQWLPFANYCFNPQKTVLNAGDSMYESLFAAAGTNGWNLAEPGVYQVQIALHLEKEDIVSEALHLRIAPPKDYDEEYFAQDFFSDDVGRVLAFDGTQILDAANDTLREAATKFAGKRVAIHAEVALASPLTKEYKVLNIPEMNKEEEMNSVFDADGKIKAAKPKVDKAEKELSTALFDKPQISAETLSHIDYEYYVDRLSEFVDREGDAKAAAKYQGELHDTLKNRGVLNRVLEAIDDRKNSYVPTRAKTAK